MTEGVLSATRNNNVRKWDAVFVYVKDYVALAGEHILPVHGSRKKLRLETTFGIAL